MPRKKKTEESASSRIQVSMPRIVAQGGSKEDVDGVKDVMDMLARSCAFIISTNKDAQVCMNMINHVGKTDRHLEIAFNYGIHDVDHFRILVGTVATAYEEIMNGHQIKLVEPIDFSPLDAP
jgi:hypothetical protein